ncbi:major facilitator superfamily domain-containing protein [Mariannaea sp. PMI_226]|nr:major facilitator superfamily domain-containing protein [Mariannaea sp. PMI_226]
MGMCYLGAVGVVSHWFAKRRSLANGLTASGSGLGGVIYSLATGAMIPRLGIPWTMRVLGILSTVVILVCGNLLRLPNTATSRPQSAALNFRILKNAEFTLLLLWSLLSSLAYIALLFSLSSYSVAVGLTSHQGSIVAALLNLGQVFGRPGVGFLSDWLGRMNVTLVATFLSGLLCLVAWPFVKSMAALCVFAIVLGLVAGTMWATLAPLAAEVVGLAEISNALGICWLLMAAPTAVSEVIAIQLRDDVKETRPYIRVQLLVGFLYIGGGIFFAALRVLRSKKLKC